MAGSPVSRQPSDDRGVTQAMMDGPSLSHVGVQISLGAERISA